MRILEILAEIPENIKNKLNGLPNANDTDVQSNVINYFLYITGIVSVVMIIIAGVQMTTSAGDPGAVAKAKKTMTYAIVGLVITILAYAIVNFVVRNI